MRFAVRAGMVGPALFLLVWIVAGLLDPHYSLRTGHGSDLSLGSVGWLMTLNFIVSGLLEVAFAVALIMGGSRVLGILVLVVGLALSASGVFPEDAARRAATTAGTIHNAAFPLLFLAVVVAAVYSAIRSGGVWRIYCALSALLVLGGTVVFLIAGSEAGDPLYAVSGLLQLVLVGVGFAWLALLAVRFDRRPVADRTMAALQPGRS